MYIKINDVVEYVKVQNRIVHGWQDYLLYENMDKGDPVQMHHLPVQVTTFSVGFKFKASSCEYEILDQTIYNTRY